MRQVRQASRKHDGVAWAYVSKQVITWSDVEPNVHASSRAALGDPIGVLSRRGAGTRRPKLVHF